MFVEFETKTTEIHSLLHVHVSNSDFYVKMSPSDNKHLKSINQDTVTKGQTTENRVHPTCKPQ